MDIAKKIQIECKKTWDSLPRGKGNLRFGRKLVSISSIAQQYYCEKALELDYKHPSPPTESMKKGSKGHESITALAEPVSPEVAIQDDLATK